ncbi:MAG: LysM peptidoglycan-binding domain-containing protein, partial [Chloroflexi bacterium]|nr:LysM peptidoglycan-binding domain-containing protein [Chloroflexota bacterium]
MRKTLFIALLTALLVSPFAPAAAQGCTYTVQPGDTVIGIASQFGLQPWELQELNQEQYPIWETLGVGWVLIVPCDGGGAPPPPSDDPT